MQSTATAIILLLAGAWLIQYFFAFLQLRRFYGRVRQGRIDGVQQMPHAEQVAGPQHPESFVPCRVSIAAALLSAFGYILGAAFGLAEYYYSTGTESLQVDCHKRCMPSLRPWQ